MSNFCQILAALLVFFYSRVCMAGDSENGSGAALLVPVISVDSESPMRVEVIFENSSKGKFRYLLASDDKSVALVTFQLFQGQKLLLLRDHNGRPFLSEKRIRELEHGEGIVHVWNLKNIYGDLKPGRYEARISYSLNKDSVLVTKYGLTPYSFEQRIYIEVR